MGKGKAGGGGGRGDRVLYMAQTKETLGFISNNNNFNKCYIAIQWFWTNESLTSHSLIGEWAEFHACEGKQQIVNANMIKTIESIAYAWKINKIKYQLSYIPKFYIPLCVCIYIYTWSFHFYLIGKGAPSK